MFPFDQYCVNHVESNQGNKFEFWQIIHGCVNDDIKSDYIQWHELVDLKIIPGLLVVSMLFFGLLFMFIFKEQKEKLFGSVIHVHIKIGKI